jgi:hypothetical protein
MAAMAIGAPHRSCAEDKPTESKHRKGPHGLEGWTLSAPIEGIYGGHEPLPFSLVIARNGRILHRFRSGPFVRNWIFWNDGKQVAYEAGPLHFSLSCVLADVATGRAWIAITICRQMRRIG